MQTTSAPKLLKLKLFYVQYFTLEVKGSNIEMHTLQSEPFQPVPLLKSPNIRINDSRLMTIHFLKD